MSRVIYHTGGVYRRPALFAEGLSTWRVSDYVHSDVINEHTVEPKFKTADATPRRQIDPVKQMPNRSANLRSNRGSAR